MTEGRATITTIWTKTDRLAAMVFLLVSLALLGCGLLFMTDGPWRDGERFAPWRYGERFAWPQPIRPWGSVGRISFVALAMILWALLWPLNRSTFPTKRGLARFWIFLLQLTFAAALVAGVAYADSLTDLSLRRPFHFGDIEIALVIFCSAFTAAGLLRLEERFREANDQKAWLTASSLLMLAPLAWSAQILFHLNGMLSASRYLGLVWMIGAFVWSLLVLVLAFKLMYLLLFQRSHSSGPTRPSQRVASRQWQLRVMLGLVGLLAIPVTVGVCAYWVNRWLEARQYSKFSPSLSPYPPIPSHSFDYIPLAIDIVSGIIFGFASLLAIRFCCTHVPGEQTRSLQRITFGRCVIFVLTLFAIVGVIEYRIMIARDGFWDTLQPVEATFALICLAWIAFLLLLVPRFVNRANLVERYGLSRSIRWAGIWTIAVLALYPLFVTVLSNFSCINFVLNFDYRDAGELFGCHSLLAAVGVVAFVWNFINIALVVRLIHRWPLDDSVRGFTVQPIAGPQQP